MNEYLRTFVALELPSALKTEISRFQLELKDKARGIAKWVDPESVHLTIKFLGNTDIRDLSRVKESLAQAVSRHMPITLFTGGTGFFPRTRKARVLWIGLEGDTDGLANLHKDVDAAMAVVGFPPDLRPFAAHLTLARLREGCSDTDRQNFALSAGKAMPPARTEIGVSSVALFKSHLTPQGPVYSRLAIFDMKAVA